MGLLAGTVDVVGQLQRWESILKVNMEDIVFALIQLLPARCNCINNLANLLPAQAYNTVHKKSKSVQGSYKSVRESNY